MVLGVVVWCVGILGFGLSIQLGNAGLAIAIVFLAIAGVGDLISVVFRSTMIQQIATDEVRGRLQGLFNVSVAAGQRLGDVSHGVAATMVGTTLAVPGGGVLVILSALLIAVLIPVTYRYRFRATEDPQAEPAEGTAAGPVPTAGSSTGTS